MIPIILFFTFLFLLAISFMLRLRARDSLSPSQRTLVKQGAWARFRLSILLIVLIIGGIKLIRQFMPAYQLDWVPAFAVSAVLLLTLMMLANQRRLRKLDLPATFLRATRNSNLFLLTSLFALWAQFHIQQRNAMSNVLLQYQHDYPARSKN